VCVLRACSLQQHTNKNTYIPGRLPRDPKKPEEEGEKGDFQSFRKTGHSPSKKVRRSPPSGAGGEFTPLPPPTKSPYDRHDLTTNHQNALYEGPAPPLWGPRAANHPKW